VFVSGYCVSATLLGQPDVGIVGQAEMTDVAARVCRAAPELMVVVDGDTGYGGVDDVVRTADRYEQAGAAGIFIEDQVWPKRCGHMAGKQVVSREEWLSKIDALVRRDGRLFVTARTDARAPLGLDEAIERAKMAADLGADAVFVEAPESVAELERIDAALPGVILVANMVETGRTPLLTPEELDELGFRLIVTPVGVLFAATKTMMTMLSRLRDEGTLRSRLDELVTFEQFGAIVDLATVRPDAIAG